MEHSTTVLTTTKSRGSGGGNRGDNCVLDVPGVRGWRAESGVGSRQAAGVLGIFGQARVPVARVRPEHPVDQAMRKSTQQHKRRGSSGTDDTEAVDGVAVMSVQNVKAIAASGRLVGALDSFSAHLACAEIGVKTPRSCKVCGGAAHSMCTHPGCTINGKGTPLHCFPHRDPNVPCAASRHDLLWAG